MDWISYLIKLVCQGILVFGAALDSGEKTLSAIWTIFKGAADEISGKVSVAIRYVGDFMSRAGVAIGRLLTKVFVDTLYQDFVVPSYEFVTDIPGHIWKMVKRKLNPWSSSSEEEFPSLLRTLGKPGDSDVSSEMALLEIQQGLMAKIEDATERELQVAFSQQTEIVRNVIKLQVNGVVNNAYAVGLRASKSAKKILEKDIETSLVRIGVGKLWKDLSELKFRSSMTGYVSFILLFLTIFSILGISM